MDTYSGNTKVEITFAGYLYLATLDMTRAQGTANPLEAAELLAESKQKIALAVRFLKIPRAMR